ncbi:MAG: TolC family protein [Nitrospinota bacterium]|nr:TolC family protein [Nitrospinota bacterium]
MHRAAHIILAAVAILGATAQESMAADTLSLEKAVRIARETNPGLAAKRAMAEAAGQAPSQAGSLPDPMFTMNAMNLPVDSFSTSKENMTQFQVGISQRIPYPGKLGLHEESAEHKARGMREEQMDYEEEMVRQVRLAWWNLFYLDRAIEIVRNSQNLLRQLVLIAEMKYKVGNGLQQDVLLAQLELSKLLDKEIGLASLREQMAASLNGMLNQSTGSVVKLPRRVNEALPRLKSGVALQAEALRSRPLLAARTAQKEAAKSELELARKGYYPDFNLAATYGFRGANPASGEPRSDLASVMLSMSIPLYAGSRQSRLVAQRIHEQDAVENAYVETENNILASITGLMSEYRKATAQAELFKTGIIPQAKQTVESMQAGYQVNKVDFLNLVRAQITLYNYEMDYWKSVASANQALASLMRAVGQERVYE